MWAGGGRDRQRRRAGPATDGEYYRAVLRWCMPDWESRSGLDPTATPCNVARAGPLACKVGAGVAVDRDERGLGINMNQGGQSQRNVAIVTQQ